MSMVFKDRVDAGGLLAGFLTHYANRSDVLVLGLARGGVPVACEVARTLRVPFDVFLVRKLGVPGHEELAMGAIADGPTRVINEDIVHELRIPIEAIERETRYETAELQRREHMYRDGEPPPSVSGLTVILVDDGLATGFSMRVAVSALRPRQPARIVVAVPVASPEGCEMLRAQADEVICARVPRPFGAVSMAYENFSQTTDEEVREFLARAHVSSREAVR
jgi:predicted phosphoribosyltransferase